MPKQKKILVVEDEEFSRRMIKTLLDHEGFKVYSTDNAKNALNYLKDGIDLVLTDLYIGKMDGIELMKEWLHISSHGDTSKMPQFIIFSGETGAEHIVAAIKAGAQDYLAKPLDGKQLVDAISNAIENKP